MPLEALIQRILLSRPDLTRDEVLKMITEKEKSAKGFLTPESAARAVAAELGVEPSKVSFKHRISIGDLVSGLGDVTVTGRVILVNPLKRFVRSDGTEGKVRRLFIADMTAKMKAVLWDEKAEMPNLENLIGKIVRLSHGYVRRGLDGRPELNIGSRGDLQIAPSTVPDDDFPRLESFFKKPSEIFGKERTVNVLGIVGPVYATSDFTREDGSEGKVRRLELKDKTGRITVVLWNNKVDELAELKSGKCIEILRAKVRKSLDGSLELHVDSRTDTAILTESQTGFEDV